jgi:hypothetical protein
MNSREILKRIRQPKIRTNRIVTEMLAGCSFQSSPQAGGVSRTVEHGGHFYKIRLDAEKDAVFLECLNRSSANRFAPEWKSFRVFQDALNGSIDFSLKSVSQTRLPLIVPRDGVLKFKPRFEVEYYLAAHFRLLSLSASSARICSQGIPLSGLRLNRSARRSASSICAEVKPSSRIPNSSKICPATSRLSFSGKRRICTKISVALTSSIYRDGLELQAEIYGRAKAWFHPSP